MIFLWIIGLDNLFTHKKRENKEQWAAGQVHRSIVVNRRPGEEYAIERGHERTESIILHSTSWGAPVGPLVVGVPIKPIPYRSDRGFDSYPLWPFAACPPSSLPYLPAYLTLSQSINMHKEILKTRTAFDISCRACVERWHVVALHERVCVWWWLVYPVCIDCLMPPSYLASPSPRVQSVWLWVGEATHTAQ